MIPVLQRYGVDAARDAALRVLGYPAEWAESPGEISRLERELKGKQT
jgi:hypothetical protein